MIPMIYKRGIIPLIVLFGAACVGSGCQSTAPAGIPSSAVTSIPHGITYAELTNRCRIAATHQFTASVEGRNIRCVSLTFHKPHIIYYFIFKDDRLFQICERPSVSVEMVNYRGALREVRKPENPFERMERTLKSPDLTGGAFEASLAAKLKPSPESPNVLPAFILLGPLLAVKQLADSPAKAAAYRENARISAQFEAMKVELNMATGEVKLRLGEPVGVLPQRDGRVVHAYGKEPPAEVRPEDRASWLAVVFREGRVSAVFTHDFFDERWKLREGTP